MNSKNVEEASMVVKSYEQQCQSVCMCVCVCVWGKYEHYWKVW